MAATADRQGTSGLAKLCLLLLSTVAVLGVTEGVLRLARYDPLGSLRTGRELLFRVSSDPDVKYELIPGASAMAWGVQVDVNAGGYRGRMSAPGAFGGFRTIALGDSITFGYRLPVEATYPDQLQRMLDPAGVAHDVLNLGVGGYDTLQEVAWLKARGLAYRPDLIVVGFCLNDVGIASPSLEYIERVRRYQSNGLLARSRLAQLAVAGADRLRTGSWMREKNRPDVFAEDYKNRIALIPADERELHDLLRRASGQYPSHWYRSVARIGRLRYAFEALAALAAREKFSVVVLIFPWLVAPPDGYPHVVAHEIVGREARRVGFDVIDLLEDFMRAGMVGLRVDDADATHPNREGHRIAAERLAPHVREVARHR